MTALSIPKIILPVLREIPLRATGDGEKFQQDSRGCLRESQIFLILFFKYGNLVLLLTEIRQLNIELLKHR